MPAAPEPERVHLHMPVDVRSASLAVIAFVVSVYALHWAGAVFIPLLLGVMFSYVLSPAGWGALAAVPSTSSRAACPPPG
jgi:multisubunit Na+/H+ antiporter MnhG subunit